MSNYYAYVDKADTDERDIFLEFHCLPIRPVNDWTGMYNQQFRNILAESQVPAIILNSSLKRFRQQFPDINEDQESNWYQRHTNKEQRGLPADLYADENAPGDELFVDRLEPLDPAIAASLEALTSFDDIEDASEEEINTVLAHNSAYIAEFVAVYHVGQGNSNAICADNGMPLLYFDLGGGCYKNKSTYPTALNFCFTEEPLIILSHWDTDHYETAKRNTAYQSKTWIVPRQLIGPAHLKFLLRVRTAGTVLIWPRYLTSVSFHWGTLVVCTHHNPKKKNHTGLAFMVSLRPKFNSIKEVLLPADAAYTYIPGHKPCDGLVATHHGAEFDTFNAPVPGMTGKGAIAYSYGAGNSYGHPRSPAIAAHLHTNRCDTNSGHIALTDHYFRGAPCGGSCSLGITQSY